MKQRNIFIVLLAIIVVGAVGYFAIVKNKALTPQTQQAVFTSQGECEETTGKPCSFQMCDYVPPGKTFEEVCGKDFKKGWTPRATTSNPPVITDRDSICILPYGNETNITDSNHPLVAESRKVVLDYGISEDYFNKHFKLLCAVVGTPAHRGVKWQYTIGEFTTIIYDDIGGNESTNIHSIDNNLYGLTEIEKVITQAEAEQRMQSCIGDFEDARMGFGFPKGFDRSTSHATPFLTARSVKIERGLDIKFVTGTVDLQTGECIKGSGGVIHAPLQPY